VRIRFSDAPCGSMALAEAAVHDGRFRLRRFHYLTRQMTSHKTQR
jgi:hypothetical protein